MRLHRLSQRPVLRLLACLLVATVTLVPALALADDGGFYQETKLVSDLPGVAQFQDPNLVNPWGLSHSPTSPWWVSDNGTGVSTLYNGAATPAIPLVVTIPAPGGGPGSAPTGNIFNDALTAHPDEFVVTANGKSGPSRFMFSTEDGTISGWTPAVDGTHAIIAVDRSKIGDGALYKGLTMARSRGHDFIYATNFRFGTVEMFDSKFHLVRSFTDDKLAKNCPTPGLCYAPFGIQAIGDRLFVTFALQGPGKKDDVGGAGNGFVDIFNTDGRLVRRFAARGALNSPWGVALAPKKFGRFSEAVLVGNFGDGRINAFDRENGKFLGSLKDSAGKPLSINGLWAIQFGNGAAAGALNELYFTAGLNDEANGLFGKLQAMKGGDH